MKTLTVIFTLLFCIIGVAQDDEKPVVLLVSDNIQQADILAKAAGNDVLVVSYQTQTTNLDQLYNHIKEKLSGRFASSIGFAAHDFGEAKFYLTGSRTISLGSTLSSAEQQKFWKKLGGLLAEDGRIDLFACNLAKTSEGKMLLSALEELSGVDVSASNNETGNPENGGDWVLESDALDISYTYFQPRLLEKYSGLLWAEKRSLMPVTGMRPAFLAIESVHLVMTSWSVL